MIPSSVYSWMLLPLVAIAGFLAPGYLLTRLIPSASVALSSFLGSILVLFWIVLGNQLLGLPLDLTHVGGGLGLVTLGLVLAARKKPAATGKTPGAGQEPALRPDHFLYLAAAVLGLASILVRAAIDPLSGYDNIFRWNGLSLEMLRTQSLSYYPAVSSGAFAHYAWTDGMAPLVSSLNFWLYLGTGSTASVLTIARLALEAGLLFFGVFQFARVLWGSRAAGWTAMGMLATSSLALWSVAMGQEAGLTALTLVAMLYFLHAYAQSRRISDVVWAGAAAAAGALSREYGLAYIIIGALILLSQKSLRPGVAWFLMVAVALSAPWYLRNAWMTGNPLYSMNVLGLFPVNPVYRAIMEATYKTGRLSAHPEDLHDLVVSMILFLGAVLIAATAGAYRLRFKSAPLVFAGIVVALLWIWAIGQSGAGWTYSMRVLSPLIAISAILSGNLARLSLRTGLLCGLAALALSVDAARRSWAFPSASLTTPWSLSFDPWAKAQKTLDRVELPELWSILRQTAGDKAIVVDHPGNFIKVRRAGGLAVPLFSPRVDCMFDPHKSFAEIIAELRVRNIRFITLVEQSPLNDEFNRHCRFFQALRQDKFKVLTVGNLVSIYDVEMITVLLKQTPAASDPLR
ncbi:MAG: hypothetical protein WC661_03695 [Opitutaceae bacterium]|jgi:hypothetical protein